MRQKSGSMLCPSCRKLISVDEKRCPHCGALRPGLWGWGPSLQNVLGTFDPDFAILATCVILYLIGLAIDIRPSGSWNPLTALSPSTAALFRLGMTGGPGALERPWTMLTAVYLHGGLLHIFFNMMALRQLGPEARTAFGPARFFVLFTVAGVAGFVLSNLAGGSPSIGASGAIFGLVGALFAHYRRHGGHLGAMLSRQLLQWAIIMFAIGLMVPSINNLAHLGGFAAGFAFGHRVRGSAAQREGRNVQLLAAGLVVLTLVAFGLAVLKPPPFLFGR